MMETRPPETVPREDYDALEASLRMAEELATRQAARIAELEASVVLLNSWHEGCIAEIKSLKARLGITAVTGRDDA